MKRKYVLWSFLLIAFIVLQAFGSVKMEKYPNLNDTFFKTDEEQYSSVNIGNQEWMVENLNISQFRNGDSIPQAKTAGEWSLAGVSGQPAWCYYNFDKENGKRYGKLYNWYAVKDPRGLAPIGWHIPSDEEWSVLTDFIGGEYESGSKLKHTDFWVEFKGKSGNGTNESGFSALPGGILNYDGTFLTIGELGYWWSSSEINSDYAWSRILNFYGDHVYRYDYLKSSGLSVRCVKNKK
jgi:uncharacterized protein (TIGR02145 family)